MNEQTIPGAFKPSASAIESIGICIYGRPGVGKTTLVGTMPGRGLVIDVPQVEGGTFVLADHADRIDVKTVETWNEIDDVYDFLDRNSHPYKWVAIDSLTAFVELAKRKAIRERRLDEDAHVISQQEWGKIGGLISELIWKFRKLKTHTIWVAQERSYGGDGDPLYLGPAATPSSLSALTPSMMLIGRLSVENHNGVYQRRLRIGPSQGYITKVRAKPGLDIPNVCANPNLTTILRYLLGNGERPEEADEAVQFFNIVTPPTN